MTSRRPSPAMIVAIFALVMSLSGVSYAAIAIPRNSVGTPQLKKNAVTGVKVRNNTLGHKDIKEEVLKPVSGVQTYIGTDFRPVRSGTHYDDDNGSLLSDDESSFRVRLDLPQGVEITAVEIFAYDEDPLRNVVGIMRTHNMFDGGFTNVASEASAGDLGYSSLIIQPSTPLVVDNATKTSIVEVRFTSPAGRARGGAAARPSRTGYAALSADAQVTCRRRAASRSAPVSAQCRCNKRDIARPYPAHMPGSRRRRTS